MEPECDPAGYGLKPKGSINFIRADMNRCHKTAEAFIRYIRQKPSEEYMEFQQSQTYTNVLSAYQQELMSSTLYRIYSDKAVTDGFIEISTVFDTASRNDFEHARIFLRQLGNGTVPPTADNLLTSANSDVGTAGTYRQYANTARDEGFTDLAALFNGLANIKLNHDLNFRTLYNNVEQDQVFCKPADTLWICMQCGNIMSGKCAPEICPICSFPQGYYRLYTNPSL